MATTGEVLEERIWKQANRMMCVRGYVRTIDCVFPRLSGRGTSEIRAMEVGTAAGVGYSPGISTLIWRVCPASAEIGTLVGQTLDVHEHVLVAQHRSNN